MIYRNNTRRFSLLALLLALALFSNLSFTAGTSARPAVMPPSAVYTVAGWGDNSVGQLSLPAGLTDVTAISAGGTHSLALQTLGTVVGWGDNTYGQATPPAGLTDVTAISAGGFLSAEIGHSLALKSDGTVVGWGDNSFACQATPPGCVSSPVKISAGGAHSLVMQVNSCVQAGCSPQQQASLIIAQIQALVTAGTLTQNQGAGLIDKLNAVITKLDQGQTTAACGQLDAFINQVQGFINNGTLTSAQGQPLIDAVNAIRASIGC